MISPVTHFVLPAELSAGEPPEARGLTRDGVRLLVADDTSVRHARFRELGRFLEPGDLVVVNTSATLPAAVDTAGVTVHFSTPIGNGGWIVELRQPDQSGPVRNAAAGARIRLGHGTVLTLLGPADRDLPGPADRGLLSPADRGDRLWRARLTRTMDTRAAAGADTRAVDVDGFLARHGRPITYRYLRGRWPLAAYQTVFAREPGSAEMPSAGRPFTAELVTALVSAGIAVAPVTLHTGVSSLESGEPPQPERFRLPEHTAGLINWVHADGGRVVAVGTTVTRAVETVARPDGTVRAGSGWTDLVLRPDRPTWVVDGLITGLHEPEASHLLLLEAVAGASLVQRTYDAAIENRYLWHEFGDSCLLLPSKLTQSEIRHSMM